MFAIQYVSLANIDLVNLTKTALKSMTMLGLLRKNYQHYTWNFDIHVEIQNKLRNACGKGIHL